MIFKLCQYFLLKKALTKGWKDLEKNGKGLKGARKKKMEGAGRYWNRLEGIGMD